VHCTSMRRRLRQSMYSCEVELFQSSIDVAVAEKLSRRPFGTMAEYLMLRIKHMNAPQGL
jgi:hypothetical protein